ncbi:MAG: hypothetical protein IJG13_17910, partial [Kiritimatiellae bacterium]|nr:hypothetical protein [Kiritimatiellia bacterium]
ASITGGGFLVSYKGNTVNTKAALDGMIVGNYEATINSGTNYYVLTEKITTYTVQYVYGLEQESTNTTAGLNAGDPTPAAPVEAEITGYTLTWQPATNATVSADATYIANYAANTYNITCELGGGTQVSGSDTSYTYDSAAAQTVTIVAPTYEGGISNFIGWTISPVAVTTNSNGTVNIPAGQTGDITLTANWEAAQSYPTYIDTSDSKIKGQYDAWATANSVPAGANNYEAAFLLNVAPGLVGATLNATAVSISGTTVTIDINHNVNGYPYIKKAATVAGLASATPIAIESITPADLLQDLDNGARITLTGESAAAQFYQIGVQSAPVAVPNAD